MGKINVFQIVLIGLVLVMLPDLLKTGKTLAEGAADLGEGFNDNFTNLQNKDEKAVKDAIDKIPVNTSLLTITKADAEVRANNIYNAVKQSGTDETKVYKNLTRGWSPVGYKYYLWPKVKLIAQQMSSFGPGNIITNASNANWLLSNKCTPIEEYSSLPMTKKDGNKYVGFRLSADDIRLIYKSFSTKAEKGWVSSEYWDMRNWIDNDDDGDLSAWVDWLFDKINLK